MFFLPDSPFFQLKRLVIVLRFEFFFWFREFGLLFFKLIRFLFLRRKFGILRWEQLCFGRKRFLFRKIVLCER